MVDQALTDLMHSQVPFSRVLGLSIVEGRDQKVVATSRWSEERCTVGGAIHGGFLMACADSIGALAAFMRLPKGAIGTTTLESKTNLMGSVRSGEVTITSRILHAGRTTTVVQTDIENDDHELVSRTVQTQLVLRPNA